jgi:glycerophosphoryl diester phosphodiesterase
MVVKWHFVNVLEHGMAGLRASFASPAKFLNIAHRGARAFAPENTLESFRKAVEIGCDMIELDVHRSKDGTIVVHHDDNLKRCTDVIAKFPGRRTYNVSDFTWEQLAELDAGSWFVEELKKPICLRERFLQTLTEAELDAYVSRDELRRYASGSIRIPQLSDVLEELAVEKGPMVNIEIKTLPRMYPELTVRVIGLIQQMNLADRVLISSFDHEQLVIAKQLSPDIATAVLTSDRIAKPGEYLSLLGADAYHPGCYDEYDSMGFGSVAGKLQAGGIEDVRRLGLGVNVWTCNDVDHMRRLIAAGVTGLISDYPNRVNDCREPVPP